MLRGDGLADMPIASGSVRRLGASRNGPVPLAVRAIQTARPNADVRTLSPRRL